MCGIAGIIDIRGALGAPQETLLSMLTAMRHRGPDGDGIAMMSPVYLGHRRLSILDVEGGAQPMSTPDGRFTITFNGEIYNFQDLKRELELDGVRFRTHCDTEVLPFLYAKYGPDMVSRLNGMYAFAIWDRVEKSLFIARDRVGIKPLFYWSDQGALAFASELSALLKHPLVSREIDVNALSVYFTLNYIPAPLTAFSGVSKLPAGHWLMWKDGVVSIRKYWDLPAVLVEPTSCTEEESLERLDAEIRRAVRMQMISDVPLGAFLSGGIDSGLVVSYMAEVSDGPVRTFSIGFDESGYNELPLAKIVAQRYGTEHYELLVRPDATELLSNMVQYFGEPFGDASCIPTYLVSKLAREHVKVCLSGDGGDETFAGYTNYLKVAAIERARKCPRPILRAGVWAAGLGDTPLFRGAQRMMKRALLPFPDSYLEGVSFLDYKLTGTDLEIAGRLKHGKELAAIMFRRAYRGEHAVRSAQYIDINTYMVDDILTKVDRTSMGVSLEVRVPLLDHVLMEWANTLPVSLKLRGKTGKYLLRRLAARRLSMEHVRAPKKGFGIPLAGWLRGPLRELVYGTLMDKGARISQWIEPSHLRALVQRHMDGIEDHSGVLWSLLFFESWIRGLD